MPSPSPSLGLEEGRDEGEGEGEGDGLGHSLTLAPAEAPGHRLTSQTRTQSGHRSDTDRPQELHRLGKGRGESEGVKDSDVGSPLDVSLAFGVASHGLGCCPLPVKDSDLNWRVDNSDVEVPVKDSDVDQCQSS